MIPSTFVVQCPACGMGLEAKLCSYQVTRAYTESSAGLALEVGAYAAHDCEYIDES